MYKPANALISYHPIPYAYPMHTLCIPYAYPMHTLCIPYGYPMDRTLFRININYVNI